MWHSAEGFTLCEGINDIIQLLGAWVAESGA